MFGKSLSAALQWFGVTTVETPDEEEASRLLQSGTYLAAFINEGKHGFDGVAGVAIAGMLCEASPATPVVVLRHINQQMLSGTKRCLLKPIRRTALRDVLLKVAEKSGTPTSSYTAGDALPARPLDSSTEAASRNGHVKRDVKPEDRSALKSVKQTVLLVEDNIVNQKVGVRMLRNLGCEVDVVDRGDKAVDAVQSGKYGIVFMDVQMPEMDGLEATSLIRSLGDITQPTIIALTANATTEDRTKCLAAGMDDYASKPVNSQTLESLLARWSQEPSRALSKEAKTASPR